MPHPISPSSLAWDQAALAWLLTYLVHSSLLLSAAWLLSRLKLFSCCRLRETLWKAALLGGFFTASLQLVPGFQPLPGSLQLAWLNEPIFASESPAPAPQLEFLPSGKLKQSWRLHFEGDPPVGGEMHWIRPLREQSLPHESLLSEELSFSSAPPGRIMRFGSVPVAAPGRLGHRLISKAPPEPGGSGNQVAERQGNAIQVSQLETPEPGVSGNRDAERQGNSIQVCRLETPEPGVSGNQVAEHQGNATQANRLQAPKGPRRLAGGKAVPAQPPGSGQENEQRPGRAPERMLAVEDLSPGIAFRSLLQQPYKGEIQLQATPQVLRFKHSFEASPLPDSAPMAFHVALAESEPGMSWATLALGLWAAGAGLLLLRLACMKIALKRRLRQRQELAGSPMSARLRRLCRQAGLARPIRLTSSDRIAGPFVLGSSEICVPLRAESLTTEQQESLLAHELAHIVRRDSRWLLVSALLERLFFFQPLNWLARRRLQEEAEYLCDDWAVGQTGQGTDLARCLAEVARWIESRPVPMAAPGMAGRRSIFVNRVRRLCRQDPLPSQVRRWKRFAAALALLASVSLLAPVISIASPNLNWTTPTGKYLILRLQSDEAPLPVPAPRKIYRL